MFSVTVVQCTCKPRTFQVVYFLDRNLSLKCWFEHQLRIIPNFPKCLFFFSLCVIFDDLLLAMKLIKVRKVSHHIGKNLCYKSDIHVVVQFNPIFLGSNSIFLCFKLIIIYYHTQKQWKIKFKPRTKLNHNIYKLYISIEISVDPPTSTPLPPS